MNFLSVHGHSVKDVDTFALNGSISRKGHAHNMFDNNPQRNVLPSKAILAPNRNTDSGEGSHRPPSPNFPVSGGLLSPNSLSLGMLHDHTA